MKDPATFPEGCQAGRVKASRKTAVALTLGLALLGAAALAQGRPADWNQWRGPNRDGHVPGFKAPATWPKELTRKWRVTVGEGHSSPLLVGDRAYIHSRQGENEILRAISLATGKELWKKSYLARYEMHPAARSHGKGPKSTPAYAGGRLYTLGISGILTCWEARSGKILWQKQFSQQHAKTSPLYGTAMSPLLADGLLIVHVGGQNDGALTAFDPKTGAVKWRWAEDGPAYASPIVATIGGVRQLITQTQKYCAGFSLADGKLLWRQPFTTAYEQNAVTPVVIGDLAIFGGTGKPTFALRLRQTGGKWTAVKAWETREVQMYMSSPVLSGGRLYGMSQRGRGTLFCLDAKTGKPLWTGAGRFGDNATLLDAGAVILALNTRSELHVLRKTEGKLVPVTRYRLADGATWAAPAVKGNRILVKDTTTLALWELPR